MSTIVTDDFSEHLPSKHSQERLIEAEPLSAVEEQSERALRPKLLDDYVGQIKIREQLDIFIGAARTRILSVRRAHAKKPLTTHCYLAPLDWVKPPWRTSSRGKWA